MDKKIEKARLHSVVRIGNEKARFEARLPTGRFGPANELLTQEVRIGNEEHPTCDYRQEDAPMLGRGMREHHDLNRNRYSPSGPRPRKPRYRKHNEV